MGASDCVTKPQQSGNVDATRAPIRSDLIPKVKELCRKRVPLPAVVASRPASPVLPTKRIGLPDRVDIVAIGASTGGRNALGELLPGLHKDFTVPIVLVQHMPPLFTRLLADRLNKQAAVEVHEGGEADVLAPGHVWIAPGDFHMKLLREGSSVRLTMNQAPPQNSCRPSVDVLFESVAEIFGSHSLGVVLTGMGSDGLRGAECIREAGGQVIVQDELSSVVWGMPGAVATAGLAEGIYPLHEIAEELHRRTDRLALLANSRSFCESGRDSAGHPYPSVIE